MKSNSLNGLIVAILVVLGVAARIAFREIPNFAPVAAIALFAGYSLKSEWMALSVPVMIMSLSDAVIGTYDWRMMMVVYSMLAFPVVLRGWMRKHFVFNEGNSLTTQAATPLVGLIGGSLLSSILFYLVTNFGSWLWFDMYERTWGGLWECYVSALPFFRYTLAGDLIFGVLLFGSSAWVSLAVSKTSRAAADLQ